MPNMLLGPFPRQRLYTTWGGYCRLVPQLLGLGRNSDGRAVQALVDKLCAYTGAAHAVAVPMARTGIYLALSALISPGTRVLMSPYTIADVVNMVVSAGGVPVFCDVERDTGNISADEVARRIDDNVGCVLVTHFYGLACDIEQIAELCRDRGLSQLTLTQGFLTMPFSGVQTATYCLAVCECSSETELSQCWRDD